MAKKRTDTPQAGTSLEAIQQKLRDFCVSGMAQALPVRLDQARREGCDYLELLERLLNDEMDKRQGTLVERRFKASKMPARHTLDQFDFGFNPSIPKRRIMELATTRFVASSSNILMVGPPGVGKTHMAVALGMNAILQGYTVAYRSAFDLADDLAEASETGTRKKKVHQLVMPQVLIVDEFGMKALPANAAEDFLEIIHRRHGEGSTVVVTNRPVEDWGRILGDNAATSAILDRFLEQAELIAIEGKSYRMDRKRREEMPGG
jgi:DNA replication protein DnaC